MWLTESFLLSTTIHTNTVQHSTIKNNGNFYFACWIWFRDTGGNQLPLCWASRCVPAFSKRNGLPTGIPTLSLLFGVFTPHHTYLGGCRIGPETGHIFL